MKCVTGSWLKTLIPPPPHPLSFGPVTLWGVCVPGLYIICPGLLPGDVNPGFLQSGCLTTKDTAIHGLCHSCGPWTLSSDCVCLVTFLTTLSGDCERCLVTLSQDIGDFVCLVTFLSKMSVYKGQVLCLWALITLSVDTGDFVYGQW